MKRFLLFTAMTVALCGSISAQNDTTYTNRRGDTVQRQGNVQNGSGTVNKTVTGPNGTTTVDKSVNGNTVDKTVTGPKGNTYTDAVTRTGSTVTKTQTGPKGNTKTVTKPRARLR